MPAVDGLQELSAVLECWPEQMAPSGNRVRQAFRFLVALVSMFARIKIVKKEYPLYERACLSVYVYLCMYTHLCVYVYFHV